MENSLTVNQTIPKRIGKRNLLILLLVMMYSVGLYDSRAFVSIALIPIVIVYLLKADLSYRFLIANFMLFLYTSSYAFTMYYHTNEFGIADLYKAASPIVFFILGYMFVRNDYNFRKSYYLIYGVILALTAFGVLSYLKTVSMYGSYGAAMSALGGRYVVSLWDDNFLFNGTILNSYIAFGIMLLPLIVLSSKQIKFSRKILLFLFFLASFYTALNLGNRTSILILIVGFLSMLFLSERLNERKLLKIAAHTLVLILLYLIYLSDFLSVKTKFENTLLGSRLVLMDADNDPRIIAWSDALRGLIEYPFGGENTSLSLSFAHNMWLDVGYEAGLIPFLLLSLFTVYSITTLGKFIQGNYPTLLKNLIIGVFITTLITFLLEPVIQGFFYLFVVYCMFLGIITRLIHDESKSKCENTNY